MLLEEQVVNLELTSQVRRNIIIHFKRGFYHSNFKSTFLKNYQLTNLVNTGHYVVEEGAEKNNEPYPISRDGRELLDGRSFARYENYRKQQFLKYRNLTASELAKKRNLQNNKYEIYKKEVADRNNIKYAQRLASPFVIGYGLAVVASSSLSSALLSIERNTRKKED